MDEWKTIVEVPREVAEEILRRLSESADIIEGDPAILMSPEDNQSKSVDVLRMIASLIQDNLDLQNQMIKLPVAAFRAVKIPVRPDWLIPS